jgi:hypothetical protein
VRALPAGLAAIALVVLSASCADTSDQDEGNLMIRCPGAGGAVAVTDGQVSIDGALMRVSAELNAPVAVDRGATFAIDVQFPASVSTTPRVECVRMRDAAENAQWDAVPERTAEVRGDRSTWSVRAMGGEGPHWQIDERIEVTVWLKTAASGRHVLNLGAQPVRRSQ